MAQVLNEELLENVAGGKAGEFFSIKLTGPYWEDSLGNGKPNDLAIGWSDLKAELVYPSAKCPFRISHNGVYIGWTVANNFVML